MRGSSNSISLNHTLNKSLKSLLFLQFSRFWVHKWNSFICIHIKIKQPQNPFLKVPVTEVVSTLWKIIIFGPNFLGMFFILLVRKSCQGLEKFWFYPHILPSVYSVKTLTFSTVQKFVSKVRCSIRVKLFDVSTIPDTIL